MKSYIRCTASLLALSLVTGGASVAFAQDTTQPGPSDEAATRERVVVTGSRVATGADAPTPVTTVTTEAINQVELPNIADALAQLPALSSSVTANSNSGQGETPGSVFNLRGGGVRRTLVLVDGKRFVPSANLVTRVNFAVNVDSIPQGLVERVDVVTGGASAAYGSDAVSGVVNFVLDKDFEGLSGEVNYGETSRNDGRRYSLQLNGGAGFDDDRGHVLMSMEYARDEGIPGDPFGLNPRRPWQDAAHTRGRDYTPDFSGAVVVPNARLWTYPLNGLVTGCTIGGEELTYANFGGFSCPVFGTSFNNAGTATTGIGPDSTYDFGDAGGGAQYFWASGGDGYNPGPQAALGYPSTRTLLFTRADYDISDKLNVYVEAQMARSRTQVTTGATSADLITGAFGRGYEIPRSYAFLPDDLAAAMDANDITHIFVQNNPNYVLAEDSRSDTKRIVTGATYDFDGNWQGEIYYTYGEVNTQLTLDGVQDTIAVKNALSAVKDPVTGAITCAVGGPDCVPWNVFGRELSAAAYRYINPLTSYETENTQQVIEATVDGTLFTLPAGDVDVAFGAGYRTETLNASTDTRGLSLQTNAYLGTTGALSYLNQPAASGELEVWEYFGEAQVPLLEDLPLIDSLDLNLAARQTEYDTSGGVTTWKAGLVWSPFEGLRFRTARSRDIRAPNIIEAFSPPAQGFYNAQDPRNGTPLVGPTVAGGNPDLLPEEADTTTIGFVWQPNFLPAFTATVDYFTIETDGEISTIGAQRTLDLCFAGDALYCQRVNPGDGRADPNAFPTGAIGLIETPFSNFGTSELRGLDVELGYNQDLDIFGQEGRLSLRTFASYIYENSNTVPGTANTPASVEDFAYAAGSFSGLITANYVVGDWTFGLVEHFVGPGRLYDPYVYDTPRFVGDRAEAVWWTDLSVKRAIGDKWEVYGSMLNAFDEEPSIQPMLYQGYGTNAATGDVHGRRFLVGVRFRS